jgi:hypothetical protein
MTGRFKWRRSARSVERTPRGLNATEIEVARGGNGIVAQARKRGLG